VLNCLRKLLAPVTQPRIRIVNQSKLVTAAEVAAAAAAIHVQVNRDFAPDWGKTATVTASRRRKPGDWIVVLADTIDVTGALGYHNDLSLLPHAIVDVALCKQYGLNWTVTLSHEVLEMLGDPTCNLVMPYPGGKLVAYEACDAVEADHYGYVINGVLVSDFQLQAWFTGHGTKYDFMGHLSKPLTLLPGGYISVHDSNGWHQVFAAETNGSARSARAYLSKRRPK